MKKFQFALMCAAALAFVACEKKDDGGVTPPTPTPDPDEPEFVSKISVTDKSAADWDNLPADYVFTATSAAAPAENRGALKSVKVFNDEMYLNLLVEWDAEKITDKAWVPFHIYIDADNSDATGGYADEFAVGSVDICLETAILSADDAGTVASNYNPAVFKWWGEVGAQGWIWSDPNGTHDASDKWGAVVGEGDLPIGVSQVVADNMVEIQILRELIPAVTVNDKPIAAIGNEFKIGFDIQQNWTSVGVLPNADADETGAEVKANLMTVKTYLGE